jgi:hypothetical protein
MSAVRGTAAVGLARGGRASPVTASLRLELSVPTHTGRSPLQGPDVIWTNPEHQRCWSWCATGIARTDRHFRVRGPPAARHLQRASDRKRPGVAPTCRTKVRVNWL